MFGEWPFSVHNMSSSWDLTHALQVLLVTMNGDALFRFGLDPDITGNKKITLSLDQAGLTLKHPQFYQGRYKEPHFATFVITYHEAGWCQKALQSDMLSETCNDI